MAISFKRDEPTFLQKLEKVIKAAEADPALATPRNRKPGRARLDVAKVPVTIYLDPAVVATWRATGKGWRARLALNAGKD